jgi:glycosyltransferase involved in cell wall biosynthesis
MSTKNYKISCFSIIYEAEIFMQGLIDNILEQEDFENIEFIFINPKSPDKSKNILLPYLEKYINFKLIDLDLDPGLYECWNIGVKESSSDIITNWNPDDRRTADSIKSLANTLILLNDYDLVYGLTLITKNKNEKPQNCESQSIFSAESFSIKNLFFNNSPHCMPVWRKKIHEKFGYFDNSYVSAGDGDMWLRAAINGSKFFFLKKIIGSYYESDSTVSRNKDKLHFLVNEVYEMRCKNLQRLMRLT